MRVALYHDLPQGGALRFVQETLKRSSQTHHYDVYRDSEASRELDGIVPSHNIDVHDVHTAASPARPRGPGALGTARDLIESWRAEAEIARQIDAAGHDVCLVHPSRLTHAPSLLARLHTRSIYYAHEPRRIGVEAPLRRNVFTSLPPLNRAALYAGDKVLQALDNRAVAAADVLACNSVFTSEALFRIYGRSATLIPPGVDSDVFRPSTAGRESFVLSVGGLTPLKGHAMVIEALGLLPKHVRPSLRVAYGRGSLHAGFARNGFRYEDTLLALAARHGVDLHLHEAVTDSQLVDLYSAARATICAARLEPFGLTPLESLSCGTPVVAISEGGFRESISHMRNGLLVPPSREGVAEGVQAIIDGRLTANRDELRSCVADRTWDRTVERLHRLFDAVAGA